MANHPAILKRFGQFWSATGAAALALCLSAGAYAQEQQQGQQPDQQQAQSPQPTSDQTKPAYAPQDADKPPYSRDRPRQNPREGQSQNAPLAQPPQPVPGTLTVPAGTILLIRINEYLPATATRSATSLPPCSRTRSS